MSGTRLRVALSSPGTRVTVAPNTPEMRVIVALNPLGTRVMVFLGILGFLEGLRKVEISTTTMKFLVVIGRT